MKYLLHIDTSTDTGTIALSGNGQLIATRTNQESRNHASSINNMIQAVLADSSLSLPAVDGIVVCAGPGSYTGLRIGLATAKGLCYALDKPLLLDNRLTLLAYQNYIQHPDAGATWVPMLIAREKEYFISIYDEKFNCTLTPRHISADELKNYVSHYENIRFITNELPDIINKMGITVFNVISDVTIDLKWWLLYAFEQYNCNNIVNLSTAEPFYLKQVYTHK